MGGPYRILTVAASLQTNDGDASFESFAQGVPRDFPLQDAALVIPVADVIDRLRISWVAKDPGGNGDLMRAGILSGGLRQFGAQQILDATGYFSFEQETFADASDGVLWTVPKLQAASLTAIADQVIGAPDPRITQLVIDAFTHPRVPRPGVAQLVIDAFTHPRVPRPGVGGSALASGRAAGSRGGARAQGSAIDVEDAEGEA